MLSGKRLLLFTGALLASGALYSNDLVSGSLEVNSAVMFGTAYEYVYKNDKEISALEWREYPLPAFQFSGRVKIAGAFLSLNLLSVLPLAVKSGLVTDSDYLLEDSEALSNYSEHDLYTDKRLNLSLLAGYTFTLGKFTLSPSLGFSYYTRKWSAVNGYLQYPVNDGEPVTSETPVNNLYGTGINYEQLIKFFHAGVESGYAINNRFSVAISAAVYPYLWVEAIDSHFIRLKQFYDTMEGGFGFSCEIKGAYYLGASRRTAITLGLAYERISGLRGETSSGVIGITSTDFAATPDYGSGTESSHFALSAGAAFFMR